MDRELFDRVVAAEKGFANSQYELTAKLAWVLYEGGDFDKAHEALSTLPTPERLLRNLIEKLKGKPVYKTLKRVNEGKGTDPSETIKALSSLLTHTMIEYKDHPEYRVLAPMIHEQIAELLLKL
jgi:hypothetical protein